MKGYDYIHLNPGEEFSEENRAWQGCPTIAITKGGRMFAGWYSGGMFEPCIDNYNILVKSDDGGESWSKPIAIIESDKANRMRNIDIQLFVTKENCLWVMWVLSPYYETSKKASIRNFEALDFHKEFLGVMCMECKNPDADELVFEEPRYLCKGFLRCRPIYTSQGDMIAPAYDWIEEKHYMLRKSTDGGKTFADIKASEKPENGVYDETAVYEYDKTLYLRARTNLGYYVGSYSKDFGATWSKVERLDDAPSSRCYIGMLKNGMIAYVRNISTTTARTGMKVCLSKDGGKTFPYELVLDERTNVSYPDLVEDGAGNLFIVYDRERNNFCRLNKETWKSDAAKEILLSKITVDDILTGTLSSGSYVAKIISKAKINTVDF